MSSKQLHSILNKVPAATADGEKNHIKQIKDTERFHTLLPKSLEETDRIVAVIPKILKEEIKQLCGEFTKPLLIRIVCQELESWYLGDLNAIEQAYPRFKSSNYVRKSNFKNPDSLNAKDMLKRILPEYSEVLSSRNISNFMEVDCNKSISFRQFVTGIKKIFI